MQKEGQAPEAVTTRIDCIIEEAQQLELEQKFAEQAVRSGIISIRLEALDISTETPVRLET